MSCFSFILKSDPKGAMTELSKHSRTTLGELQISVTNSFVLASLKDLKMEDKF